MDATLFFQLLINGIVLGAIYALIAVGLSLIFGVLEIVNFAHGELYMIGGFAAWFGIGHLGMNYWTAIAFAIVMVGCVGWLLYDGLLSTLKEHDFQRGILLTMGIAMILQNGALYFFSATPKIVDTEYGFSSLIVGDLRVSVLRLLALGLAAVSIVGCYLLLQHTRHGKSMRALAQNREAAFMVGIQPRNVARLAVIIGAALCGVAGAALAPVYSVHPLMGLSFVFKAFAIVIIGGLGNIPGAALAALLIGVMESFAGGLGSTVLQDAIAFILMILILIFRPLGLFGRGVRV